MATRNKFEYRRVVFCKNQFVDVGVNNRVREGEKSVSRVLEDAKLRIGGVPGEPLGPMKAFGTYRPEFVGPADDDGNLDPWNG